MRLEIRKIAIGAINLLLSLYCWVVIVVLTAVSAIFIALSSFFCPEIAHKAAKLWSSLILKLCAVRVNVFGEINISRGKPEYSEGSYIITANHQSYFDIFIMLAYININFRFIAKKSLFSIPILGLGMKRLGYIPLDRENLRSAFKSVKKSTEVLKNKTSILIFPEGTRSSDGNLLSFKKGGLNMLLRQKGITVLPVVIKGSMNVLKKNSYIIHPGKTVELHILKPLTPNEDNIYWHRPENNKNNYDEIIEKIENETRRVLES